MFESLFSVVYQYFMNGGKLMSVTVNEILPRLCTGEDLTQSMAKLSRSLNVNILTCFYVGAIFILVISFLFAFIPAKLAQSKGYSYKAYWIFGFFLWLPALIVIALKKSKHAA